MEETRRVLIKLINKIYRHTQAYTDEALLKYQLSSGIYPYLLILYKNEGVSQNQISRELNVDKAMSARAISKLVELGYIIKEQDSEDSRAYKLYLTEKAKEIIPQIIGILQGWITIITEGLSIKDEKLVTDFLSRTLENAKAYKKNHEGRLSNDGEN